MPHLLNIVEGKLYSSGDNNYGQLGLGNTDIIEGESLVLTNTASDSIPWISAKFGLNHSFALKEDGSIWTWGSNIQGQMGESADIKYLTKPKKISFPLKPLKEIQIKVGDYYSVATQINEKCYAIGTFQNFADQYVGIYREPTILYLNNIEDTWLTIDTGPKTLLGRLSNGLTSYSDWSGDLFVRDFTTFENLKVGDIFTLDQPNNRQRVLYKKIDTFQKGPGCCKCNALCLHRRYIDLISQVSPSALRENQVISVSDILEKNKADFASQCTIASVIPAVDQYGTRFIFYSALAGNQYLAGRYNNLDPYTLQGIYLATQQTNLIDVILFDSLLFEDDTTKQFNIKTPVERINAKEVYQKTDFPQYFLDRGEYRIETGRFYNPDALNAANGGDRAAPYYFFKINPSNNNPYIWMRNTKPYLYADTVVNIRDLEKNDAIYNAFYNPGEGEKNSGLPADEQNNLIVENMIFTDPYLIRYEISSGKSSFGQMFLDPYVKIHAQKEDEVATCEKGPSDPDMTNWMYSCVNKEGVETYSVGQYAKQLIEYFLLPETDPLETVKFFGFYKIDLQDLYDGLNQNGNPQLPSYQVGLKSFKKLKGLINNQLNLQTYFNDDFNVTPIIKTGDGTTSRDEYYNFPQMLVSYTDRGPVNGTYNMKIPYRSLSCFTDRKDLKTILIPGPFNNRFQLGATKITYWADKPGVKETDLYMQRYIQLSQTVNIINVDYVKETTLTKIKLDQPFQFNYKIGCVPYPGPPPGCGPVLRPIIYFNKPFDISQAIESLPFQPL